MKSVHQQRRACNPWRIASGIAAVGALASTVVLAQVPPSGRPGSAPRPPDPTTAQHTPLETTRPFSSTASRPVGLYALPTLPGATGLSRGSRVTIPPSAWARPRGLPPGSALSGADIEVTGMASILRARIQRSLNVPTANSAGFDAGVDRAGLAPAIQTPGPTASSDPTETVRPISDVLSERITGLWRSRIEDGWSHVREGAFGRGHAAFDTAATLNREDTEAVFGQLVATIGMKQWNRGVNTLAVLLERESNADSTGPRLFDARGALRERFAPGEAFDDCLKALAGVASATDRPEILAIQSVILWHAGDRTSRIEATAAAGRIQRAFPTSRWVRLRGMMDAAVNRASSPAGDSVD